MKNQIEATHQEISNTIDRIDKKVTKLAASHGEPIGISETFRGNLGEGEAIHLTPDEKDAIKRTCKRISDRYAEYGDQCAGKDWEESPVWKLRRVCADLLSIAVSMDEQRCYFENPVFGPDASTANTPEDEQIAGRNIYGLTMALLDLNQTFLGIEDI